MQCDFYFPTPIWWEQTEIDTIDIIKVCADMLEKDSKGRIISNEGGWQSSDFLPGTYPELSILENKIMEQANDCLHGYGYDPKYCSLVFNNIWFNINYTYNSNSVHFHDNTFISGCFYLKATPDQGNITFYKNYAMNYIVVSQAILLGNTELSVGTISHAPNTGKLVMFPGYLPHGVGHNPSPETRISMGFNIKLIRTEDNRGNNI